jgi:hypothetical protein
MPFNPSAFGPSFSGAEAPAPAPPPSSSTVVFDPANKRIILSSASISATELYSRSADWLAVGDNAKYGAVFRQVGGDDLGSGLSIPPYFFLQGGWRVRPMEANHSLTITGNLFVEGGGVPVVQTLGTYQVNVNYTVPVQAQGISTSGSTGPSAGVIAAEVRASMAAELLRIMELAKIHGLVQGTPLEVTDSGRVAGDVVQSISSDQSGTTVTRI